MARFRFKLQAVLRHREMVEQQRQRELAIAAGECTAIRNQLRALDETVKAAVTDLRQNRLVGRIDLSFLAAHRRFMLDIQKRAIGIMHNLDEAQKRYDTAQKALLEAATQKKVLEKLRERRSQVWTDDLSRKEMHQLDEVAMQMAFDNTRAETTEVTT